MKGYETLQGAVEKSQETIDGLPNHSSERIEQTAKRLEGLGYVPTLLMTIPNFIRLTKEELEKQIREIAELDRDSATTVGLDLDPDTDLEALKIQQISLMIHHFSQLSRLRSDEPEAWDEIAELYEDD